MSITGEPEGAPMKLGVAITDLVTGMNATQAVLAALLARQKTGKGQLIDLALLDSAVNVLANVGAGYLAAGQVPQRLGNGHPTVVPYQIFANSRRRAFALGVSNDAHSPRSAPRQAGRNRPRTSYQQEPLHALNRGSLGAGAAADLHDAVQRALAGAHPRRRHPGRPGAHGSPGAGRA